MSREPPILVAKLGGSLLAWSDLRETLGRWLAEQGGRRVVLIAGGGFAADGIRLLDQVHQLGEEAAHRLALRALDLTAHALAAIVPGLGLVVVDELAALSGAWATGRVPVVAPRRVLDADDGRPGALEHSWRVTSDAIAARLAARLGADLILLKSAPLPLGCDRAGAAAAGLVDPAFPKAARAVHRVDYLNLRDPAPAARRL